MRIAAIALIGSVVLMSGVSPGLAASAGQSLHAAATVELSADGEKKPAPKKAKKEKVEYMKSAAPPEPKGK
jgi:hypothetical protein